MKLRLILTAGLALLLVGCGTGMVRPTAPSGGLTVYTEDYAPSTWNLPLGSVVAEQSNLVLHKQPSPSAGLSILFGPLGVVIANESLKEGTRQQVSALDTLRTIKVQDESNRILADLRRSGELNATVAYGAKPPAQNHYLVQPYLLLEADRVGMAQVVAIVQVKSKGSDEEWQGQYVRHVPRKLRLSELSIGEGVSAEQVRAEAIEALKIALRAMGKDISGQINGEEREAKFRPTGVLAWSFLDELKGRLAGEMDGYTLMRMNYGAGAPFLFGLHVLDQDQISIVN